MKIADSTHLKTLGLGSFGMGALSANIDIKDGRIVRTRPMQIDERYSHEYLRPWSIKAHGDSFDSTFKTDIPPFAYVYKKRAYSRNRVPWPMKRVDWDPGGERNPQNRGISKYERISWDEATDIIARELKRVQSEYGPMAVLAQGDGHGETKVVHASHSCQMGLLALMGGFTMQARNPDSWEGWYWGAKHVWGCDNLGQGDMGNLMLDIAENADIFIHWGCDEETTPWGWEGQISSKYCFWLSKIGVEQLHICPDLNYSAAVHSDRWIPINPNTDAALQCAILYEWFTHGWYDKEYVESHVVGLDWEEYYILGEEDGVPKTPDWAELITGIPARIIKALAKRWHKERVSIGHVNGGSYIRSCYSNNPGRFEVVLMGMQGLGKPGRNVIKFIEWGLYGMPSQCPNPKSELYPMVAAAYRGFDWNTPAKYDIRWRHIPKTLIPDAILGQHTLDNPLVWHGTGIAGWPRIDQFNEYQYPNKQSGEQIHMIWSDTPCWTTCWNGGNRFIEALRHPSVEFFLVQHPWFENDCQFADMILPVSTKFEQKDIAVDSSNGYFNLLFVEEQCIEPIGEAKSDYEVVCEVAKKVGFYEEYIGGKSVDEWIREGFETSGAQDYISWDELNERGYFAAPTYRGWEDLPRGFQPFAEDPEANPLESPTGKLEFYSVSLEARFPGDDERPPYPKFIPYGERHQESLLHPRSKQFPFLLVSNHPRWRVHANMDDISWLREIPTCKVTGPDGYKYEPIWVNPVDAQRLDLRNGDVAKLFNDRGGVLGGVIVTERIKPGVLYQDHGARLDPIVPGELDRGGANNLIAPAKTASKNTSAEVTSGYLVDIEKVDVFGLARQYPEAFNKSYQADEGVDITHYLV